MWKTANVGFPLYPVTEASRSGNGKYSNVGVSLSLGSWELDPPLPPVNAPVLVCVQLWNFPSHACQSRKSDFRSADVHKNSKTYSLTQSVKLFHHFYSLRIKLQASVTEWCIWLIQMFCMLPLSCWLFEQDSSEWDGASYSPSAYNTRVQEQCFWT